MKKLIIVFVSAFFLNLVWENLHSLLYLSYKGGEITEFVLIKASLFDAILILIISIPFLFISFFSKRIWILFFIATVVAISNEWYGLGTHRWIYNMYMPIIPFVHVGLTPTMQLGILGVLAIKIQKYTLSRHFL